VRHRLALQRFLYYEMFDNRRLAGKPHPGLVWVIVDDAIRHVSEFARLAAGRRPEARCPECNRSLILKLGRVRRHHAAHTAGVYCETTRPETLLHMNCKFSIARRLRDAAGTRAVLRIVQHCVGGRDLCDKAQETRWLTDWDEVLVEQRVGASRRPDIVIRKAGRDLGAIEIRVTHAVPPEKETALSELAVQWVEVRAWDDENGGGEWSVSQPLPVLRTAEERVWRCGEHEIERRAAAAASASARADLDEASRHAEVLRAARVVDVYRPGGSRTRFIYRIDEMHTDARVHTAVLRRGRMIVASAPLSSYDDWPSLAWPRLRTAFAAELERIAAVPGSFIDSPMRWARAEAAQNIVEEALTDLVGRDPTPLATRFPRRWFFARERGEWFLARQLRAVRWDRDANDVFAAHPAWAQTRQSVRERAAPPGSWDTPIFAARPLAASFVERSASFVQAARQLGPVAVLEVGTASANQCRTLAIIERAPDHNAILAAIAEVDASSVNPIWVAHPSDWSSVPPNATWAPAGRDARGTTVVTIDGLGIFRADQFVRAVATNDPRVSSAAINTRMAERVARLRAAARDSD
jgi:hypothetical protein